MTDVSDNMKNLCKNLVALRQQPLEKDTPSGVVTILRKVADAIEKDILDTGLVNKGFPLKHVVVIMFGTEKKEHNSAAIIGNKANPVAIVNALDAISEKLKNSVVEDLVDDLMNDFTKGSPLAESFKKFMREKGYDIPE
jgi:hypothetical protein